MKTPRGKQWEGRIGGALLVAYEVLGHEWETSSERRRRLGECLARVLELAAQMPPLVAWRDVDPTLQSCPICGEEGTLRATKQRSQDGMLWKCARCATLTNATAKVAVVKTKKSGAKKKRRRRV